MAWIVPKEVRLIISIWGNYVESFQFANKMNWSTKFNSFAPYAGKIIVPKDKRDGTLLFPSPDTYLKVKENRRRGCLQRMREVRKRSNFSKRVAPKEERMKCSQNDIGERS